MDSWIRYSNVPARTSTTPYRIAIAEDNELMAEGIIAVLRREKGFTDSLDKFNFPGV